MRFQMLPIASKPGLMSMFLTGVMLFFGASAEAGVCDRLLVQEDTKVVQNDSVPTWPKIRARVARYFGSDWKNDKSHEVHSAKLILEGLEGSGSLLDLKIFDTYLSVLESTAGKPDVNARGFYIDMVMGQRPKSTHFQERHWDWIILQGYFFNAPSSLTETKKRDLAYLEYVLKVARKFGPAATLKQVLQSANESWALQPLGGPWVSVQLQFRAYADKKTYNQLYAEFRSKIQSWAKEVTTRADQDTRYEMFRSSLDAFRSSNSKFDLFIANQYFDLFRDLQVMSYQEVPALWTPLQLTDSQVFNFGLSWGSPQVLLDFLFQNSHDVLMKAYLSKVLMGMKSQVKPPTQRFADRSRPGDSKFYDLFLNAKDQLDGSLPDHPTPELYQADLHVFYENDEGYGGHATELVVKWDKKLGRLQVNTSWPEAHQTFVKVGEYRSVVKYIRQYFDFFRKKGTYPVEKVDKAEAEELDSPLAQTAYFVFTKSHKVSEFNTREELLSIVRVFNDRGPNPTFIEREFPDHKLPDRETGEPIYELGRLFSTDEVEANSFTYVMARVAEYFSHNHSKGMVYLDGNRAATAYYRRHGASVVYTPEQLNQPADQTPVWVMKASVQTIIDRFMAPLYETVKLRSKADSSAR